MTATKTKITVSIDQVVLEQARELMGSTNTSSVLEEALRRLVREERNRRDAQIYQQIPLTEDELSLARHRGPHGDIADDTDWATLYADVLPAVSGASVEEIRP